MNHSPHQIPDDEVRLGEKLSPSQGDSTEDQMTPETRLELNARKAMDAMEKGTTLEDLCGRFQVAKDLVKEFQENYPRLHVGVTMSEECDEFEKFLDCAGEVEKLLAELQKPRPETETFLLAEILIRLCVTLDEIEVMLRKGHLPFIGSFRERMATTVQSFEPDMQMDVMDELLNIAHEATRGETSLGSFKDSVETIQTLMSGMAPAEKSLYAPAAAAFSALESLRKGTKWLYSHLLTVDGVKLAEKSGAKAEEIYAKDVAPHLEGDAVSDQRMILEQFPGITGLARQISLFRRQCKNLLQNPKENGLTTSMYPDVQSPDAAPEQDV